jgi:hypothetical protein
LRFFFFFFALTPAIAGRMRGVVTGRGWTLGPGPEMVRDRWAAITEQKNLRELDNVMSQSLEIMKHYG